MTDAGVRLRLHWDPVGQAVYVWATDAEFSGSVFAASYARPSTRRRAKLKACPSQCPGPHALVGFPKRELFSGLPSKRSLWLWQVRHRKPAENTVRELIGTEACAEEATVASYLRAIDRKAVSSAIGKAGRKRI